MKRISIKEATFIPLKPDQKGLIGLASVLYDESLSLNCIGVFIRPDGELRIVFPNKILPNSKEVNIYYPVNSRTYDAILEAISQKYHEITAHI